MTVTSDQIKVLVICKHNSGRSQIFAAYLKHFGRDRFVVESAGFEPADQVNPLVVAVMKEEGFDLADVKPQKVFDLFKAGRIYNHVITVCSESEGECPIFPGITKRWQWSFPDPAAVSGTWDEKIDRVRRIRDMIRDGIQHPPAGQFDYAAIQRP